MWQKKGKNFQPAARREESVKSGQTSEKANWKGRLKYAGIYIKIKINEGKETSV